MNNNHIKTYHTCECVSSRFLLPICTDASRNDDSSIPQTLSGHTRKII